MGIEPDHSIWTGSGAIPAAIAIVGINDDNISLRPSNGSFWTGRKALRLGAMEADQRGAKSENRKVVNPKPRG